MRGVQRLDALQQRHRWAGFPLAVVYKYLDDQGPFLAALLTHYAFVSLFPLLLLLASLLGLVLRGDPALQARILDSALAQFPVIGGQLGEPAGLGGSGLGLAVGLAGALYGGVKVAQALQHVMNTVWGVPRDRRPDPVRARLRSLGVLVTLGVALVATTVLSGLGGSAGAFGSDAGPPARTAVLVLSVALNAGVFVVAFRVTTARRLRLRQVVPGAVAAAVLWQLLQTLGTAYVGSVVKSATAANGVFALVLGLLAWLYLASVAVVLCAEVNVVRARRLWPRALLTPFTDVVDLTGADQRAYAQQARAQRAKGFESVTVTFADDGQHATARRRREAGEAPTPPVASPPRGG